MTYTTLIPPHNREDVAKATFRPDIQGLRAIAVGLVLLYHAGLPLFPGGYVGVDVFFVISGYLITGMLLRQAQMYGRIDIADFYARRIRRILPAATVVLVFVSITTLLLMPRTRWEMTAIEVAASAVYLANWVFSIGTDYLNSERAASPLQHFWTLAVEEQFYILWPILLIGLLWVARRGLKGSISQAKVSFYLQIAVIVMIIPSVMWSVYYTHTNPAPAYFVTTTRLWEIAVGAAIAIYATRLQKLPHVVGYTIQGAGLAAIFCAGIFYSESTAFPGFAALMPVLGAAGVIIGGMAGRATKGCALILNLRPMRWIGDLSYSLYLWHWPLLVFAEYFREDSLRVWQGSLIVVLAVIPAWFSYTYIENPFRKWRWLKGRSARALLSGAALTAVGVALSLALLSIGNFMTSKNNSAFVDGEPLGAQAVDWSHELSNTIPEVRATIPDVAEADDDVADVYADGCHVNQTSTQLESCVYGDQESEYVVAVVGDSHAAHWIPALQHIAETNGWRLETYTKSACALTTVAVAKANGSYYESCYYWGQNVLTHFTGPEKPEHVIVSASVHEAVEEEAVPRTIKTGDIASGHMKSWDRIQDAGVEITVILDTPRPTFNVPECVAENHDSLAKCAADRSDALESSGYFQMQEAAVASDTATVDMTNTLCSSELCPPVIGSVLVYQDSHHLTATYAESLAENLEQEMKRHSTLKFPK